MSQCRFRLVAAMVVAAALLAAPPARAGQSPDPVPPGTLTFGPMRITPSFVLKDVGIDDNVFNEPVDPKRDFTLTASPKADVVFTMRRLKLGFTTATDYVYYRTYRSERGTNTSATARVDFDLGVLKPYASVAGLDSRARLNPEVDARSRHRDVTYAAGVAVKIASRTNLLLNGTQAKVAYEPDSTFRGFDLRQSFDGRRQSVDAGIGILLTPLTTFSLIVAHEEQRFELSPDRNSNAIRVSPTFTFSPAGLLTGNASVGYRRFHTLSAALPDYSGLVSSVTVGATIYGRHQLQGVFSRDVQYSYDLTTDYYLGTGGTLTWTMVVAGPVDVRATGGRYLMDYRGAGDAAGRDRTTSYGAGAGYRFSNRARLGINTDWSRRDSTRSAERGYHNHRIFAGLTWGTT